MCSKLGLVTNPGHSACLNQVTYSLFLPCPLGSLTAPRCPHWEGGGRLPHYKLFFLPYSSAGPLHPQKKGELDF